MYNIYKITKTSKNQFFKKCLIFYFRILIKMYFLVFFKISKIYNFSKC